MVILKYQYRDRWKYFPWIITEKTISILFRVRFDQNFDDVSKENNTDPKMDE
jgi:hypothetical protein